MKILITGGTGFVGVRLKSFLERSHEVVAVGSRELDVTQAEAVQTFVETVAPDTIVHLAALALTDYCDQHPEESYAVNVQGAIHVAQAAKKVGAKLIYASSDQVYEGVEAEGNQSEQQAVTPTRTYAVHKLEAEKAVKEILPSAIGLRLTWMYDVPSSPFPKNTGLLLQLQKAAEEGRAVKASTRERRGITNVWDVVRRIEMALGLPGGVYNFGSPNDLSSFDIWLAAAELMVEKGWMDAKPSTLVLPDESWTRNLGIDLGRIEAHGITFPSSLTGLRNAVFHARK